MIKRFVFTVDDNIRFLKETVKRKYQSIFEHPYLAMYKRLHEELGLKAQLNLFYTCDGFKLSDMTDAYRDEWSSCSDWLRLSFHSRLENFRPYESATYDEVYNDCNDAHREILRFAASSSLAKTTTLHYCRATKDGLSAMRDNGVMGMLGLFGTEDSPRTSYGLDEEIATKIRNGEMVTEGGIVFSGIDVVLNSFDTPEILGMLNNMDTRAAVKVMIHEQYFYPDYKSYQRNFEEKIRKTFELLINQGRESVFFEELI